MKKSFGTRLLALAFVLVLSICLLAVSVSAFTVEPTEMTTTVADRRAEYGQSHRPVSFDRTLAETSDGLYYGKNVLRAMADGSRYASAYETIYNGVLARNPEIDLSSYQFTEDEFKMVYELFTCDNAELYWLPSKYSYNYIPGNRKVTTLKLTYLTGFDEAAYEAAVDKLMRYAEGLTTEYEKALALHDALVRHLSYDLYADNAHNTYGAFVDRRCVCEGYAEAYQVLLRRAGIQSYLVIGDAGGAHEWNVVRLDGKYYLTDVTWDDPTGMSETQKPMYHSYFNLTDAWMNEDHTPKDPYGILPTCNDESKIYHKDVKMDSYSVSAVANSAIHVGDKYILHVFYTGTGSAGFRSWISTNYKSVASAIGIRGGYSLTWSEHAREGYAYFIQPCNHNLAAYPEKAPTCQESGWFAYQKCTLCGMPYTEDGFELEEIPTRPKTAHTPGAWQVTKNPTASEEGLRTQCCTVCNQVLNTESIPKNANITLTPSASVLTVGDTFTIKVSMTDSRITSLGISLQFDASAFELVEGTWLKTGLIVDFDRSQNKGVLMPAATESVVSSDLFLATFRAKTTGNALPISVQVIGKNGGDTAFDRTQTCTLTVQAAPCAHLSTVWKVTSEPTCMTAGERIETCTDCGAILHTEVLAALGHDPIHHDAKAPTCTAIGWEAYDTCSRCDYSTYTELAALGHDLTHHDAKAPTCTEIGWEAYDTCSRCDYSTYTELAALDHNLTHHDAKAPTCTEIGWEAYDTCSRCDYSTYTELAASGHDLTHHDAKAPTCTAIGWEAYDTCTRCDHSTYTELAALGHDLLHHDAKAPSCTEIGWEAYDTCSRCDYSTYTELAALGHDLTHHDAKAPTCTEIGWEAYDTCTRCDHSTYTELASLGHDPIHHDAKAPTCIEIGWEAYDTCSRCDYSTYTELAALGHDLLHHDAKAPTCTAIGWEAYDTCSRCDYSTYTELAALGHDLTHHDAKAPTCTEIGWEAYDTCSRCDLTTYSELAPIGHDMGEWYTEKPAQFNEEGVSRRDCSRCDHYETKRIPPLSESHTHSFTGEETILQPATCTEAGSKRVYCSNPDCGESIEAEIPALGHDLIHHDAKAPTCTEIGWEAYDTCSRCDDSTYTELASLGHNMIHYNAKAPTCTEIGWSAYDACSRCDYSTYTELAAKGHTQSPWTTVAEPNCTLEGEKAVFCTECGLKLLVEYLPAKGHTPGTAATCTSAQICTVCGIELAPATGHTAGDWEVTRQPTLTEEGQRVKKCATCGEVLQIETLPKLVGVMGDVSGNGKLDAADYLLLKRHVLKSLATPLTEQQLALADVTHDKKVNAADYFLVKRAILGKFSLS